MTLNEAISHCEDVVKSCSNDECKKEHIQLATWLKELQNYRNQNTVRCGRTRFCSR